MNRERIFHCLGRLSYAALVDATALAQSRHHSLIDLDHWVWCLIQRDESDVVRLLSEYGYDLDEVKKRFARALDQFEASDASIRDISGALERSVGPAVIWSKMAAPSEKVRSGHVLLAWLEDDLTRRWLHKRLPGALTQSLSDEIAQRYETLASDWPEARECEARRPLLASEDRAPESSEQALAKWATCLTEQAARGELDPVVGRDDELRMMIDILQRRRQNNPILVGEAGVGKTAVVEALAQRIQAGAVPPGLLGARVWALDLARLQAGAGMRGEFEARLKTVIDAVRDAAQPVILFCDEGHTLMGAGGAAGTGDAANLIKPALARGQLRLIAATTWSEYKQYIEPDAALTRRFQAIVIDEPSDAVAVNMLRTVAPRFAQHHGVHIVDTALASAVALSRRYLPARQLPDKAVSLLDTACARVVMSQSCAPAALDQLRQQVLSIEQTLDWRKRDRRLGAQTLDDDVALQTEQARLTSQIDVLETAISDELDALNRWVVQVRDTSAPTGASDSNMPCDDNRHVRPWVDEHTIAEVLSEWTGIPVTQLAKNDAQRITQLEDSLETRIYGQTEAICTIAQALQVAHTGIGDPGRPLGVFLLAGPTGTGKSEIATVLAEQLFGGERSLVRFNMNEYQEAHAVSTLKGAPPGYVGYGKGGKLTEALRKKPYSVLLLDEFDRAHADIHEMFYQAFDQGQMEDGEGRRISLRHCLILLTTNIGDADIEAACQADPQVSQSKLEAVVQERLRRHFSAPLLARMQVVVFRPLSIDALIGITRQALDAIGQRLAQQALAWRVDHGVVEWIARAVSAHSGNGRAVHDVLRQHVMPAIARGVLAARAENRRLRTIRLSAGETLSLAFEDDAEAMCESAGETRCV